LESPLAMVFEIDFGGTVGGRGFWLCLKLKGME